MSGAVVAVHLQNFALNAQTSYLSEVACFSHSRNTFTLAQSLQTGPMTASHPCAGDAANSSVPSWLSDWRLQLALGSWQLSQELWMELSGAAAACYSKCGRKRNGALMQASGTPRTQIQ